MKHLFERKTNCSLTEFWKQFNINDVCNHCEEENYRLMAIFHDSLMKTKRYIAPKIKLKLELVEDAGDLYKKVII